MDCCRAEDTSSPSDRTMEGTPDSSFGSMEDLLCGEKMEASPCPWSSLHSGSSCLSSGSLCGVPRPYSQRLVNLEYDATQYGSRALQMKLREQTITFLVDAWDQEVDKRHQYWMQAFIYFLKHSQSQEVLQLSISFLDRFVRRFREKYDGELLGSPLECLFEASLHIVEQLLDDGALHKSVANNNGDNVQLTVEMMLRVTDWDVIDWTPACFVPHFMEIAGVRQFGGGMLYQQTLALSTLFMIDGEVASRVAPSAMAALAVIVQSWLTLHLWQQNKFAGSAEAVSVPLSRDFLHDNLHTVLQAGEMSPEYFIQMTDFCLHRLFMAEYHDGLDAVTVLTFCWEMGQTLGQLSTLQSACVASLTNPKDLSPHPIHTNASSIN
ncbi:hypothetical protein RvY_09767 [Ramazzottius varieornatus]|uniref:Uncharacterized protein n=1 Tax=Ramazzottius varieornatus TaxID=947166 RepID=A0A1D1VJH4_RAMVA|nr:hypothetical protein RvY_09767 [Ramazzottius varieornatus]